jgi:3-deoxy-D-manno-octulosonic-acid transferase
MILTILSALSRTFCSVLNFCSPFLEKILRSEKARVFFAERKTSVWLKSIEAARSKKLELSGKVSAVYWIHVASAGELEQAIPVMRLLHEKYRVVFFLTYFSPSAIPFLKNCQGLIGATSLLWENSGLYRTAVEQLDIGRLILVRYDFWPALVSVFTGKNLPVCVLAATLRKARSPLPEFLQDRIRMFWLRLSDIVFLVSDDEKQILIDRGMAPDRLIVAGDAKWTRAKERADKVKANSLSVSTQRIREAVKDPNTGLARRVLVFGSPHKEEFEVLKRAIKTISQSKIVYIVAPAEVDRSTLVDIENELQNERIRIFKISESENTGWSNELQQCKKIPLILLDTFGFLAESYGLADVAVVGGGFDGQLHNVLEPAAFPAVTLFGNRASRAPEAQILLTGNAAIGFSNTDLLFQFLLRWGTLETEGDFRGEMSQILETTLRNARTLFASLPDTSEVVCKALASRDALEVS